jgi:hypothetical protein
MNDVDFSSLGNKVDCMWSGSFNHLICLAQGPVRRLIHPKSACELPHLDVTKT